MTRLGLAPSPAREKKRKKTSLRNSGLKKATVGFTRTGVMGITTLPRRLSLTCPRRLSLSFPPKKTPPQKKGSSGCSFP